MAQIPKGRLGKGPYKPLCGDCAIYFSITANLEIFTFTPHFGCSWYFMMSIFQFPLIVGRQQIKENNTSFFPIARCISMESESQRRSLVRCEPVKFPEMVSNVIGDVIPNINTVPLEMLVLLGNKPMNHQQFHRGLVMQVRNIWREKCGFGVLNFQSRTDREICAKIIGLKNLKLGFFLNARNDMKWHNPMFKLYRNQLASCGNARDTSHSPTSLDMLDPSNLTMRTAFVMTAVSTFGEPNLRWKIWTSLRRRWMPWKGG